MGSAKHGKKTRVLVDEHDLSNYLNNVDTEGNAPALDSTTFQDVEMTYVGGRPDGKATLKGFYWSKADEVDPLDRDAIDDILAAALGDPETNHPVLIAHADCLAAGDAVTLASGKFTKYTVGAPHDQLVSAMAEMVASGGLRYGTAVAPLAARTATANGATQDHGAATQLGAVAHLHVTAASDDGDETLDVEIEDSADGVSWATIGTFAQVTAKAAERLAISGTVRRYVRATFTVAGAGSPSFTCVVALARNTY